ncbi:hypothetical protein C0992_012658 [Termitomyces sp. T32_za158]|nr:hypothetical protein C0992_012658 [Termitomyces sp. T32_za158]
MSVVLDAETKNNFSGIRLILAYEESEMFNNLLIRDCLQGERHGLRSIPWEPLSNRRLVLAHRRRAQEGACDITDATSSRPPILTIAFEVIIDRMGDWFQATLRPRPFDTSKCLCIAYYRTFFTELGSFVNYFETNVSFRNYYNNDLTVPHAIFRLRETPRGIPAYNVRILPVARVRVLPVLPPSILRSIANAAIEHEFRGWRSRLLSLGLVCKAWSCMLDTFFTVLTRNTCNGHQPSPLAVARSLEMRPERGLLMNCFRLEDYSGLIRGIDNEEKFIARCCAVLTILSYATAIKNIHLPGIHASLRKEFVRILLHLENVERCTIYNHNSHMGKVVEFDMGEIQQFIAKWTKLQRLDIAFRTTVSNRDFDDEVPELQCNIENLKLRESHLTGRQFVRFTSHRLQKVELERLNGPLNRDLKSFLLVAAPSLVSLTIRSCPFRRQSMNEDYAIDLVMPQLCSLEELCISGDLLTVQSIAMKGKGKRSSATTVFVATLAPALYLEDLADALETTGWKAVTIKTLPGLMDEDDLFMKQEATEVATRRNIAFVYEPVC